MTSAKLPLFVEIVLDENLRQLPKALGGWEFKVALSFCRNFRMAGIGALFLSGESAEFLWRLHQSARYFAYFLSAVGSTSTLTSKALPFFDAVSAQDFEGAREIARLSRRTWAQGLEYEEDFLFVEFLMQHGALDAPKETCQELLHRYERTLQGAEDPRLEVCQALLETDSEAFAKALSRFLSERNDHFEELAEMGYVEEEVLATEGQLSVEGLALLQLAERRGMATEEDYLHVPSIAREPPTKSFQVDSWKHIVS